MTPPAISPTGGLFGTILFVVLFLGALVLFGIRAGMLVTLLAKARREDRTDRIDDRFGEISSRLCWVRVQCYVIQFLVSRTSSPSGALSLSSSVYSTSFLVPSMAPCPC